MKLFSGRRSILTGLVVLVVLFLVFVVWGTQTQLSGAVILTGVVRVDGASARVENLYGGTVAAVRAKSGDYVSRGQVILDLDATDYLMRLHLKEIEYFNLLATQSRSEALLLNLPEINWHPDLLANQDNPYVRDLMAGNSGIFQSYLAMLDNIDRMVDIQIDNTSEQIKALELQEAAVKQVVAIDQNELVAKEKLVKKGAMPISEQWVVARRQVEARAEQNNIASRIASAKKQLNSLKLEIERSRLDRYFALENSQERMRSRLVVAEEEYRNILNRVKAHSVTAPIEGFLHSMTIDSNGEVLRSGETIAHIIPDMARFVVHAEVDTHLIQQIEIGQKTVLLFPAFPAHTTPEGVGKVKQISPDALKDPNSGQLYYSVLITIDNVDLPLTPGMPVEVFVQTNERSPLSYLLKPMTDYLNRSFRER